MALVPVITSAQATNPNLILLYNTTGDYNASTNPGGFGTPNPNQSDIVVSTLDVTKPTETSPTTYNVFNSPYEFMVVNDTLYLTPAFFGGSVVGTSITSASNTTPIVITTTDPHGLATGDRVGIVNVGGNISANGYWTITYLTANSFSLDGSAGSGAYSSGGFVVYLASATSFLDGIWKFTSTINALGSYYIATTYHLQTALVECCISKYANTVNFNDCNNKSFKKFTEMNSQLQLAIYAFECQEYTRAQNIINRLTKICNDCGCGCGGRC